MGAVDGERVLCVPRRLIFPDGTPHGLVHEGLERCLEIVRSGSEYLPRELAEEDPSQQQIIPYCVVRHPGDGTYLLTRRLRRSTESRLHDLYSLGIGGHINPPDAGAGDPMAAGVAREWAEEVVCPSPATARLMALLKDDGSPVSRVHLGLVFLVEPRAGTVSVRETDKLAGERLSLEAMRPRRQGMETWSQLVYDDLVAGSADRGGDSPLVLELPPSEAGVANRAGPGGPAH